MTTRTSRTECYTARDTYFACLDRHSIISSRQLTADQLMQSTSNPHHRVMQDEAMQQKTTRDNQAQVPPIRVDEEATRVQELALPEECRRLFTEFRGACMSSWVMHFETLREKKAVLDRLQEQGAQFLPAGK